MSTTDKLKRIEKIMSSGPKLSEAERNEYDRISKRLCRAEGDLRRAKKRDDAKKIASAERSAARAKAQRTELLAPKVDPLWAPTRIIAKSEGHWVGPSGSGIHHVECEMILDYKDVSGPQYRTVRVLKDEGGPPTNARAPFDIMGVAWWAIDEQIKRGWIVVLDDEILN
jgi:hypothetical protein